MKNTFPEQLKEKSFEYGGYSYKCSHFSKEGECYKAVFSPEKSVNGFLYKNSFAPVVKLNISDKAQITKVLCRPTKSLTVWFFILFTLSLIMQTAVIAFCISENIPFNTFPLFIPCVIILLLSLFVGGSIIINKLAITNKIKSEKFWE